LGRTLPQFFEEQKNENFTMVPMGIFARFSETRQWISGKLFEDMSCHCGRFLHTNACLGFGVPSPVFLQGAKAAILGKLFDRVLKWQLTIPQLGRLWEIESNSIHHCLSAYSPQI